MKTDRLKKETINRLWRFIVTGAVALFCVAAPAIAQEPYYKDKTIRILVGASAGGLFDAHARILARHIAKYIPGNPTVIVENLPGAGGLLTANRLFKAAKPDGLTIGHFNGGLVMGQVLSNPGIEFDAAKFQWIGVPSRVHTVCVFTKASGITNVKRWLSSTRPVKLGSTGPGSNTHDVPKVLAAALPLPTQVLGGYKGVAEIRLAAEGGELDGICMGWDSTLLIWAKAVEVGDVIPVLQAAPTALSELATVPLASELAKSQEAQRLIEVGVHDASAIVLCYALPPGTPKEPVQMIRQAFTQTLKDSEFLSEAKKAKLVIDPIHGPELEKIINGLVRLEPALVSKLKTILVQGK